MCVCACLIPVATPLHATKMNETSTIVDNVFTWDCLHRFRYYYYCHYCCCCCRCCCLFANSFYYPILFIEIGLFPLHLIVLLLLLLYCHFRLSTSFDFHFCPFFCLSLLAFVAFYSRAYFIRHFIFLSQKISIQTHIQTH